jgi:hypothetical protein
MTTTKTVAEKAIITLLAAMFMAVSASATVLAQGHNNGGNGEGLKKTRFLCLDSRRRA